MPIKVIGGENMAYIFENETGRRKILLSADDIISIVREYQNITIGAESYSDKRFLLCKNQIFIPEEI